MDIFYPERRKKMKIKKKIYRKNIENKKMAQIELTKENMKELIENIIENKRHVFNINYKNELELDIEITKQCPNTPSDGVWQMIVYIKYTKHIEKQNSCNYIEGRNSKNKNENIENILYFLQQMYNFENLYTYSKIKNNINFCNFYKNENIEKMEKDEKIIIQKLMVEKKLKICMSCLENCDTISRCCKQVICISCSNKWVIMKKTCPNCRKKIKDVDLISYKYDNPIWCICGNESCAGCEDDDSEYDDSEDE